MCSSDLVSLVPAIAASLASPGPWLALLDGPLPVAASRSLRDSEPWRKLLDALREPGDEAKEVAALAAVAGFVHPADARAAVAQLDAAGASAPALVRLTWNLLADLEGAP